MPPITRRRTDESQTFARARCRPRGPRRCSPSPPARALRRSASNAPARVRNRTARPDLCAEPVRPPRQRHAQRRNKPEGQDRGDRHQRGSRAAKVGSRSWPANRNDRRQAGQVLLPVKTRQEGDSKRSGTKRSASRRHRPGRRLAPAASAKATKLGAGQGQDHRQGHDPGLKIAVVDERLRGPGGKLREAARQRRLRPRHASTASSPTTSTPANSATSSGTARSRASGSEPRARSRRPRRRPRAAAAAPRPAAVRRPGGR